MARGEWLSAPATADDGLTIIVTGRTDVERFRSNPRFSIRVEVTFPYAGGADGMPGDADAEMLETVTGRLAAVFDADPVAVMTGIFTGDNSRDWVFYTLSTGIFGRKLNEALADLPQLPLEIYCENDPDWAEYDEMSEALPAPGDRLILRE